MDAPPIVITKSAGIAKSMAFSKLLILSLAMGSI